jgi:hypothetical protein
MATVDTAKAGAMTPLLKKTDSTSWFTLSCIVLPPLIFNLVYYSFSFIFRDRFFAYVPYIVQAASVTLALVIWTYSFCVKRNLWMYFLAALILGAGFAGAMEGDDNYGRMQYYYTFQTMAAYVNINPSLDLGVSYGDAGEVYFKEGSRVDTTRAVAFRNTDLFCAAPIVMEPLEGGGVVADATSMDWWAVGVNCCLPSGEDFTCGETTNGLARSGMRLLEPYDLPYYQFAVHQWTAKYKVPADHPLFFSWVTDPLATNGMSYLNAHTVYYESTFSYTIFNLFLVICFRVGLSWSSKHM